MNTLRIALLLLGAVILAGCGAGAGGVSGAPGSVSTAVTAGASLAPTVSVADAAALQNDGALIVDVREPAEWAQGHIDGATLIPLGDQPARLGELDQDRQVVVVCRTGRRSAQGRDILLAAGFPSVTSLDGGMSAWIAAGMPVTTGS